MHASGVLDITKLNPLRCIILVSNPNLLNVINDKSIKESEKVIEKERKNIESLDEEVKKDKKKKKKGKKKK